MQRDAFLSDPALINDALLRCALEKTDDAIAIEEFTESGDALFAAAAQGEIGEASLAAAAKANTAGHSRHLADGSSLITRHIGTKCHRKCHRKDVL